jgi:hypothetical protein
MNKKIKYIVGLIFIIGLLYNIKIYNLQYKDLFFKEYNNKYFIFLVIIFFSIFLTSVRFLLILKKMKIKINIIDSFKLSLNQFSFNTLLFSGAGEIDKYFQKKFIKIRSDQMLVSLLVERLFGAFAAMLLLVSSIFVLLFLEQKIIFFTILLLFLMLIFFFSSFFLMHLLRLPYLAYFNNVIKFFFKNKKFHLSIFILSLFVQFLSILVYYYIFNFYLETTLIFLFITVPIFNFLSLLPITIAGIGIRDFFFSFIFFYFGISNVNVIPATLLIGMFILKTALIILIFKYVLIYLKLFFLRKDVDSIDVKKIQ